MAKAVATCMCEKCGREFEMTAIKFNRREADNWEKWAADYYTVCSDCWNAEKEEERRLENEKLPAIVVGTEKQIAWAIKIRLGLKKRLDIMRNDVEEESLKKFDEYVDFVFAKDDATFWINNRDDAENMGWIASEENAFNKIAYEFFN